MPSLAITTQTSPRLDFAGPPVSPINRAVLPESLRHVIDTLPPTLSGEALMRHLERQVPQAHALYHLARHLDQPAQQVALLTHSAPLRAYLGMGSDRQHWLHRAAPIIPERQVAEALAWAVTRLAGNDQQRAFDRMMAALPTTDSAQMAQTLDLLRHHFDQLPAALRLRVVDKLLTETHLRDVPDAVLLPVRHVLETQRPAVSREQGGRIDRAAATIDRMMFRNLAANLPEALPDPQTFHTDRTGPHLLRNIASSIPHADGPSQQLQALRVFTSARLAALPPHDRTRLHRTLSTLRASAVQPRRGAALAPAVRNEIDRVLQIMEEQEHFLAPLRAWQHQLATPPSDAHKKIAVARLIDCWQSGAVSLNLSGLDLPTLPAVLPAHIKQLDVSKNALVALPDLPSGLTALNSSANPLLTSVPLAQLTLLNPACEVDLSGTGIRPDDLARLHTQIAHFGGLQLTVSGFAPQAPQPLADALHWLAQRIGGLPDPLMDQRALDRILATPFDDLLAHELQQLRTALPDSALLPATLQPRLMQIQQRIDAITPHETLGMLLHRHGLHWPADLPAPNAAEQAVLRNAVTLLARHPSDGLLSSMRAMAVHGERAGFAAAVTLIDYELVDAHHADTLLHAIAAESNETLHQAFAATAYTTIEERITALIRHHADIEARNADDKTPLDVAITNNSANNIASAAIIVQTLRAAGAQIELPDADDNTLLHRTVMARNIAGVRVLLENGADVRAQNLRSLPAMARYAAIPAEIEARMFAQHNGGRLMDAMATPLHLAAAFSDDAAMIKTLLSLASTGAVTGGAVGGVAGASGATSGVTSGAITGAADANVHSRHFALHWPSALSARTPLHGFVDQHRTELHTRAAGGQTPLHYAARFAANADVINALIDAGEDIEARTADQQTPLHLAAADATHPEIIRALCAAGASTTALDNNGMTPQQRYARRGLVWPV
jgi:ankyrin repeat protein